MTSRPNPEDGKPATNLNPITYAATAWATLGMASHVTGTPTALDSTAQDIQTVGTTTVK